MTKFLMQLFGIAFACGALWVTGWSTDALPLPWWAYFLALMIGEANGNRGHDRWLVMRKHG